LSISPAALTDELDALLAEREDLPERHFAAREQTAVLWIRSESVRMEEIAPDIQAAQAAHGQAQEALEAAREAANERQAELGSLTQSRYIAKERRKAHEAELDKLAATGVQGMPDL
jgi:dihydroxyacetone kinase